MNNYNNFEQQQQMCKCNKMSWMTVSSWNRQKRFIAYYIRVFFITSFVILYWSNLLGIDFALFLTTNIILKKISVISENSVLKIELQLLFFVWELAIGFFYDYDENDDGWQ